MIDDHAPPVIPVPRVVDLSFECNLPTETENVSFSVVQVHCRGREQKGAVFHFRYVASDGGMKPVLEDPDARGCRAAARTDAPYMLPRHAHCPPTRSMHVRYQYFL